MDGVDKQMVWGYMDRKHPKTNKSGHKSDHSVYVHTNKDMLRRHTVGKFSYLFWESSMTGWPHEVSVHQ